MTPRTDKLIESLVADAAPVRPLWAAPARLAAWLGLCGAYATVVTWTLGGSLWSRPHVGLLAGELGAALAALLVWATLALRAAVPGGTPRAGRLVLAVAAALTPTLFWHAAPGPADFVAGGIPCAVRTVALALLPCLTMLWAVGRGAPLGPSRAAMLSGGAGFLTAYLLMRSLCNVDEPAHLLVWHALPVAAGVGVAAAGGAWWLARWRR